MIEIAVVGMTLKFVPTVPPHTGDISITGISCNKVLCEGLLVYQTTLGISITNGSNGAGITNATGAAVVNATSIKVLVEGLAPLRKGDLSTVILMTGVDPLGNPAIYNTQVEIDNQGQTKVLGN